MGNGFGREASENMKNQKKTVVVVLARNDGGLVWEGTDGDGDKLRIFVFILMVESARV